MAAHGATCRAAAEGACWPPIAQRDTRSRVRPSRALAADLRFWNAEILADLSGEVLVDFGVTRNGRCPAGGTDEDRMASTLPKQTTTALLQVADQRAPFHALTLSVSRMTGPLPVDCWANSRLASRTIATASWRFARASSSVAPCVLAPGSSSTKPMYPSGTWRKTAVNWRSMPS
jgi:hypothetical protein